MQRNDIHYNALQFLEITNLISIKVILTNVKMKFLSNVERGCVTAALEPYLFPKCVCFYLSL